LKKILSGPRITRHVTLLNQINKLQKVNLDYKSTDMCYARVRKNAGEWNGRRISDR